MIMVSKNCSLALIWWRVDILASSSTIFWLNRRHESQPGEQLRGGIVWLASLASSNVDGGPLLKPIPLHKSKYNAGTPACVSKLWIVRYCCQNIEYNSKEAKILRDPLYFPLAGRLTSR